MCNACNNPNHLDIEALLEDYEARLAGLQDLIDVKDKLTTRDQTFASSLIDQFLATKALSARQWEWVGILGDRVKGAEPIYGDFKAIEVMLMLAADNIQTPKIRLMTNWRDPDADHRFVQLTFSKNRETGKREILVHIDGWAGHGYRKFAGWINENHLMPWRADRMTDDVKNLIQDFSMDPARVARACAGLLGACSYCGQRLTDDTSKAMGYGPVCAKHYGLPWGAAAVTAKDRAKTEAQMRVYTNHEGIGG